RSMVGLTSPLPVLLIHCSYVWLIRSSSRSSVNRSGPLIPDRNVFTSGFATPLSASRQAASKCSHTTAKCPLTVSLKVGLRLSSSFMTNSAYRELSLGRGRGWKASAAQASIYPPNRYPGRGIHVEEPGKP